VIVVTIARKPLSEPTVAASILATGTGGIHVDACRIGTGTGGAAPVYVPNKKNAVFGVGMGGGEWDSTKGRWPTNLLLEHRPGCRYVGTEKVRGTPATPSGMDRLNAANAEQGYRPGTYQKGAPEAPPSRNDEDGMETVDVWDCVSECPVAVLDSQTANLQPSKGGYVRKHGADQFLGSGLGDGRTDTPTGVIDAGGASRFFKQVGGGSK
jgi:hypothetical protein